MLSLSRTTGELFLGAIRAISPVQFSSTGPCRVCSRVVFLGHRVSPVSRISRRFPSTSLAFPVESRHRDGTSKLSVSLLAKWHAKSFLSFRRESSLRRDFDLRFGSRGSGNDPPVACQRTHLKSHSIFLPFNLLLPLCSSVRLSACRSRAFARHGERS